MSNINSERRVEGGARFRVSEFTYENFVFTAGQAVKRQEGVKRTAAKKRP